MHTLIGFLVRHSLRLPPSSLGLAQELSLLSQVQAQVAQKNVHRVEGRISKRSSLSSGVVPSTAAVAAAKKNRFTIAIISRLESAEQQPEDWLNLKSQRHKRGKLLSHLVA